MRRDGESRLFVFTQPPYERTTSQKYPFRVSEFGRNCARFFHAKEIPRDFLRTVACGIAQEGILTRRYRIDAGKHPVAIERRRERLSGNRRFEFAGPGVPTAKIWKILNERNRRSEQGLVHFRQFRGNPGNTGIRDSHIRAVPGFGFGFRHDDPARGTRIQRKTEFGIFAMSPMTDADHAGNRPESRSQVLHVPIVFPKYFPVHLRTIANASRPGSHENTYATGNGNEPEMSGRREFHDVPDVQFGSEPYFLTRLFRGSPVAGRVQNRYVPAGYFPILRDARAGAVSTYRDIAEGNGNRCGYPGTSSVNLCGTHS